MEPVRLLEALAVAEKLKDATRHCYTSGEDLAVISVGSMTEICEQV